MIEVYRFLNGDFRIFIGDHDRLTCRDVPGKPELFSFDLFVNRVSVRFQCSETVQMRYVPLKRVMSVASFKDLRTNSIITVSPTVQYVLFFRDSLRDEFVNRL